MVASDSRRCRGVPRNHGVQLARGEVIVFLDADACPGERLLERHLTTQRADPCIALGDIHVIPGTEPLLDPSNGTPMAEARFAPGSSPAVVTVGEENWASGVEEFLLRHAVKGGYPDQAVWYSALEEMLRAGTSRFAWVGAIPHNMSMWRRDILQIGGFDPFLGFNEGWDLGIRAQRAGIGTRFADGARSFHLFHWRPQGLDAPGLARARATLCRRFADDLPQAAFLWVAASGGDPLIPCELDWHDWRVVDAALGRTEGRRQLERFYDLWQAAQVGPSFVEYVGGAAINSPMARRPASRP
jgi:hypothetical protein